MLKTGEMLNMLNVWLLDFWLNFAQNILARLTYVNISPVSSIFLGGHQVHLTYLTYPLF